MGNYVYVGLHSDGSSTEIRSRYIPGETNAQRSARILDEYMKRDNPDPDMVRQLQRDAMMYKIAEDKELIYALCDHGYLYHIIKGYTMLLLRNVPDGMSLAGTGLSCIFDDKDAKAAEEYFWNHCSELR